MAYSQADSLFASYNFNACNGADGVYPKAFGITTNVSYAADRFSNPGSAATFDGATSTIALGAPTKANVSTGLTISSWIKLTSTGGQQAIVSKWTGVTNDDQYLLLINGDKTCMAVGKTGSVANGYTGTTSLVTNTWYHIVATWDTSGSHQTYINGVLDINAVSSTFKTINSTSLTNLSIGSQNASSRFFNGSIDDVEMYNRKLSLSEILDLYNAPNPIVNGLVSKYSFDNLGLQDEISHNDGIGMGSTFGPDRFGNATDALNVSQTAYVNLFDSYDNFSSNGTNGRISYSFWVKFNTITATPQIILAKSADSGCSGNDRQFLFRLNASAKLEITSYGSPTAGNYVSLAANSVTCLVGQWYHIALIYNGSQSGNSKYKIYVNNVDQTLTQTATAGTGIGNGPINAGANIGIGAYLRADGAICVNAQRLDAYFDDLHIYNRALDATEVNGLYTAPDPATVGLSENTNYNQSIVYPNPFTELVTIRTSAISKNKIDITSIDGKLLFSTTNENQETTLNTNDWATGIYFITIQNDAGKSTKKIIKQ